MNAPLSSMARNILSVFYAASEVERRGGLVWYMEARSIAFGFSERYGVTLSQAAGLIALLSPQKHWGRNVEEAERVLDMYKRTGSAEDAAQTPGLFCRGVQREKIQRLLEGADPLALLTTPKVRAFYLLVYTGGDADAVCVDGHATNIAQHGLRRVGIESAKKLTPKQYDAIAEAYREGAAQVGITAAQMQAVTWVVYRNL